MVAIPYSHVWHKSIGVVGLVAVHVVGVHVDVVVIRDTTFQDESCLPEYVEHIF
jgi:hypothetical protein